MAAVQSEIGWGAAGVLLGAIINGFFNWVVQRSKGGTDTEVAVLGEWSKLNGALADRLAAVEREFSEYRVQVAKEFEELRQRHRAEMRAMRELNEGLQRQIAQNSQSTAHLLGSVDMRNEDDAV